MNSLFPMVHQVKWASYAFDPYLLFSCIILLLKYLGHFQYNHHYTKLKNILQNDLNPCMPTTDCLDRIPLKYNEITIENGENALGLLDQLQKLQDHPHSKELKETFPMVYYMFMFN